jgi:GNAT superfamily N-acetyltransferase
VPVIVEPMAQETLDRYTGAIQRVYQRAFDVSDEHGEGFISKALARHRTYSGFQGYLALDSDQVVGFVYGYPSRPGGWWHSTIRPGLIERGHESWLDEAFEFVELAVDPSHQGHGIGGGLHDTILRHVAERAALLSTGPAPSNAHHLYASRGWETLIPKFRFTRFGEPAVIMGLDLPAYRSRLS